MKGHSDHHKEGIILNNREEIEELARSHPKFRAFANEIDSCMQLFERSKEWSDYVSALSKLIKVFQRSEYNDVNKVGSLSIIPEKALLARRLNQCTNPILPSGVHRKALDAYRVIITRIGTRQLATDLALWSSGLFSLFPHANTECKHLQLRLFSDLYLPLGPQLAPCMTGLITSLLPGIEDEASEFFTQTFKVLDDIQAATSPRLFFLSMWWILSCCTSVRQPVLRLLDSQLTMQGSLQPPLVRIDVLPEKGSLVLGSLRAALEDTSILVQRGVLDLVVGHFPMHSEVWDEEQWGILMRCALRLYGRRDMSLTRRLHTWLRLGANDVDEALKTRILQRIVSSLSSLLREDYHDMIGATLPFRVLRVLSERPELSDLLPRRLAVSLLTSLSLAKSEGFNKAAAAAQAAASSKDFSKERFQFGCSLLREFEPCVLWGALSQHVQSCWGDDHVLAENLRLITFFLSEFGGYSGVGVMSDSLNLSIDAFMLVAFKMCCEAALLEQICLQGSCGDSETCMARIKLMITALMYTAEHVRNMPNSVGSDLEQVLANPKCESQAYAGSSPLHFASRFLSILVGLLRLPPLGGVLLESSFWGDVLDCLNSSLLILRTIFLLMNKDDVLNLTREKQQVALQMASKNEQKDPMTQREFADDAEGHDAASFGSSTKDQSVDIGGSLGKKIEADADGTDWLTTLFECCEVESPSVFCVGIRALLDSRDVFGEDKIVMRWPVCGKSDWSGLAATLWNAMDDSAAAHAASELFLRIQRIEESSCRSVVSRALLGEHCMMGYGGLSDSALQARKGGYIKFGKFWSMTQRVLTKDEKNDAVLSHGLMIALDGLVDKDHNIQLFARNFVINGLAQVDRVVDPVLRIMLQAGDSTWREIDVSRVTHAINRLCAIVSCAYEVFRANSDRPVSASLRRSDTAWVQLVTSISSQQLPSPQQQQNHNDVWLRQQTQGSSTIECLPPNCDYLSAVVLIVGRFISAKFKTVSPCEYSNVRSVAGNLLMTILQKERQVELASQMVNLISIPVLLTLQAALRENDEITQVRLLELLGTMFTRTDGHLLPAQHLHGDTLGLARQLFVRTLLAGLEHAHPLDSPASDSWIDFACSCISYQRSHVRLEGFLIPVLVSLCKRLAKCCLVPYSDDATHEVLSLIRAIALVFRMSVPLNDDGSQRRKLSSSGKALQLGASSRDIGESSRGPLNATAGSGDVPGAAGTGGMFGKWTMFGGPDDGSAQAAMSDEAIDTLIKLLVPPGWIPEADGTTSVLGALLMCWGPANPSCGGNLVSSVGTNLVSSVGTNQKSVRASVLQVIFWLFDAFPLQTLAALFQVWDVDMAKVESEQKGSWRCEIKELPQSCKSIAEVMSEVGKQYPEEEHVLNKCMELLVQLVRRKRNDMSFKFKFTEASVRQFFLTYVSSRTALDPKLRLLHVVTATIKECITSSDDPVTVLGLCQLFDAFSQRLPSLTDRRDRRALQECLHLMVNACLTLADMCLPAKLKSSFSMMGGANEVGVSEAVAGEKVDTELLQARSKIGVDALEALAEHLASLLDKAWKDGEERVELLLLTGDLGSQRDRFGPLITKVVHHLKPIIRARTTSMITHSSAATKVLASLNHPMFVKLWRKDVLELFQDPDFFQMGGSAEDDWLTLVDVVMSQEAGAFSDLLGTSPLVTVFKLNMMGPEINKYQQHADYIKRLAFVVLAGDIDQYLSGLHEILEKLVESLRLPPAPGISRIYRHVFLCTRVLLLRFSPASLISFWPIVLSEVYRLLRVAPYEDADPDISYAALRFLDLLITLQPEEFLLMQWAFVAQDRHEARGQAAGYWFLPATEAIAMEAAQSLSYSEVLEFFAVDHRTGGEQTRPMLQRLEVADKLQVSMAAMLLSSANHTGFATNKRPDIKFIFEHLRREFYDFHQVPTVDEAKEGNRETVHQGAKKEVMISGQEPNAGGMVAGDWSNEQGARHVIHQDVGGSAARPYNSNISAEMQHMMHQVSQDFSDSSEKDVRDEDEENKACIPRFSLELSEDSSKANRDDFGDFLHYTGDLGYT